MKKLKRIPHIRILAAITMIGIIGYSTCQLTVTNQQYEQEKKVHEELLAYKPEQVPEPTAQKAPTVNQPIIDLQKVNPDVQGWVTIPGTQVDYPFLCAEDYDKYLRTDLYGGPSIAGSVFLDYRSAKDLTDFQTILYGHNMKNGSMFGSLSEYRNRDFYTSWQKGYIQTAYENLALELVSCLIARSDDADLYGIAESEAQKELFIELLREGNIHGSESTRKDLSTSDRFILLSTCSYDYSEARTVVVFRIAEKTKQE